MAANWLPSITPSFVTSIAKKIGKRMWSLGTQSQQAAIGGQTLVLLVNVMSVITHNKSKGSYKGVCGDGHIVLTPPTIPPLSSREDGVVWRAASSGLPLLDSMLDILAASTTSHGGFDDVRANFNTKHVLAKLGVRVGDTDVSTSSWYKSATATIEAGMESLFSARGIAQSTVMADVMLAVLEVLLHAARVHAVDAVENMPQVTDADTDLFVLEFQDLMTKVRERAGIGFEPTDLDLSEDLTSVTERLSNTRVVPSPESAQWYSLYSNLLYGDTLQPELVIRLALTIFFDDDDDILISTLARYNEVGTVFHRESPIEFTVAHGDIPNSSCYQLKVLSPCGHTQTQSHAARSVVPLHVLLIRRDDIGNSDVLYENLPTAPDELDTSVVLRLFPTIAIDHTKLLTQMTGIDWTAFATSRYIGRKFPGQQASVHDRLKIDGPADNSVLHHAREQLQATLEFDDASKDSKKSTSTRETDLYAGVATAANGAVALLRDLTAVYVDILFDLSTNSDKAKGISKARQSVVPTKTVNGYFAKYARGPGIQRSTSMVDRAEENTGASASDSYSNCVSLRKMDVQRLTDSEEGLANLLQLLFCNSPDVDDALMTILAAKAPTEVAMSALSVLTGKMFHNAARALEQYWLAWPTDHILSGEFIRTHTAGLISDAKAQQAIKAAEPKPRKRKVATTVSDDSDDSQSEQEASAEGEYAGRERKQPERYVDEPTKKKSSKKRMAVVYPVVAVLDMIYDQTENAGKALIEWGTQYGPKATTMLNAHRMAAAGTNDRYTYQFKITTESRQWSMIESHDTFKVVKGVYDSSITAVTSGKRKRGRVEPVEELMDAIKNFKVDNPKWAAQLEQVLNSELNSDNSS